MNTWLALCFTVLLLVLPFVPAIADDPDDKEIARRVKANAGLAPAFTLKSNFQVISVAFSPDGKLLASSGGDRNLYANPGELKIWDAMAGKELLTLKGHTALVHAVAFSPDGKTLASASLDWTVKLWDVTTGKERATLKGHTSFVYGVAFAPDGKTLASASDDQTIKLWELSTGKERVTLKGHTASIVPVAFSPDGKTLASGSNNGTTKLWDVPTGKERASLNGLQIAVHSVAFSPDGKTLASGGIDHTVKLWDMATGQELATLKGHTESVSSVAFSPDGKTLASGGYDWKVKLWELSTCQKRGDLDLRSTGSGWVFWEVSTCQERATLSGHMNQVFCVAFSPDGKTLASAGEDRKTILWDMTGRRNEVSARTAQLSEKEFDSLWCDLASADSAKAYQAILALAAAPPQTAILLKARVRPITQVEPRRVAQLIAGLDSGHFKVREEALQELTRLAELAEPELRKALKVPSSLEAKRRIEALLEAQSKWTPEKFRALRVIEVLEISDTQEARTELEALAKGPPNAWLTQEAQAARARRVPRPFATP